MTDVIASQNFLTFFHTNSQSAVVGAINATFSGGAVFGSLMGGFTMDRLGRRKTIQMGAVIALVGAVLQCAAYNLAMMLVGRITAGWAIGLMSMSVPVYQAECAPPKIRGLIVGLTQQMIGVGFIVSTWIGYGCNHAPSTSSVQWRFPLAFQALPALVLFVGLLWMPESPRYLIETGQEQEGKRVLRILHYEASNDEWLQSEFLGIKMTIAEEKGVTVPGWLPMFRLEKWRTRLIHGTLVQVFTQLTGVNVINYYQTIMYDSLGFTGHRGVLVAALYNIVGPITNFFFIVFLLDRVGRRKPLLFGAAGITVALVCEAILNAVNPNGEKRGLSIAGVFFIFSVSVIFSLSFGPISWVYMSEIMPLSIRGRGNAFATGIGNWLVSTLFAQVSPIALNHIQWRYYFVFAAFNIVVTIPTIALYFKETKQLTLEEIDLLFDVQSGRQISVNEDVLERARERKRSLPTLEAGNVEAERRRLDDKSMKLRMEMLQEPNLKGARG
ncbi:MAG: hypothetical protein M1821_009216 [Bathelium mastoideum]|nr:MAG: hypothetical protein M1821_009216 [Bathelium mastoideum]KAI9682800.1 MAG: hypothetical protein M1822_006290 [Bathelium mastoideum]